MSVKYERAMRGFGPVAASRIGRNIPRYLWRALTSRELAVVAQVIEATYLDGYAAAGGDTYDTINHREAHRQHLIARLGAD